MSRPRSRNESQSRSRGRNVHIPESHDSSIIHSNAPNANKSGIFTRSTPMPPNQYEMNNNGIPHFATFDPVNLNQHDHNYSSNEYTMMNEQSVAPNYAQPVRSKSGRFTNSSQYSTSGNSYSSRSSSRHRRGNSQGTNSLSSAVQSSNGHSHRRSESASSASKSSAFGKVFEEKNSSMNALEKVSEKISETSSMFSGRGMDAEDLATFKEVNLKAAEIEYKYHDSIDTAKKSRSQSARRSKNNRANEKRPMSAGNLRSVSVNSQTSQLQGQHRRNQDATPIQRNTRYEHNDNIHATYSKPPPIPAAASSSMSVESRNYGKKYRTRSKSPIPNRMSSPKISSRSRRNLKQSEGRPGLSEKDLQTQKYYASKKFTFQSPQPLLTFRKIDLKLRASFEKRKLMTVDELYEYARQQVEEEQGLTGGTLSYSSSAVKSKLKKMSPSPHYLELLQKFESISQTRHLCWSPAASPEADPFYGWDYEDSSDDDNETEQSSSASISNANSEVKRRKRLEKKRKETAAKRFGKYRRIDISEYIKNTLPDHQPLLTNIKRRLPMRSDVGFPRATEEEIQMKQMEIAKEAQLEEVSPRLIVLLGSDDLGHISDDESSSALTFAGDEIMKVRRLRSYVKADVDKSRSQNGHPKPNMCSIFAPPLDATSSSTDIWRPRPFSDQPVGVVRTVVVPAYISFGIGDVEPLVCRLSLYNLPKENSNKSLRGKISEDFIFPAGDWGDRLEGKSGKMIAEKFGLTPASQKNLEKKALFSFDPTNICNTANGDNMDSLYLFMQIMKVAHEDADEYYLDASPPSSFKGLTKRNSQSKENFSLLGKRARDALDTFGTQFLTPFCFGVIPLLREETKESDIIWPDGCTQTMQLFSCQYIQGDKDEFLDKIQKIAEYVKGNPPSPPDLDISLSGVDSSSYDSHSTLGSFQQQKSHNGGKKKKRFLGIKSKRSKVQTSTDVLNGLKAIDGAAVFYSSMIGSDFTQCLLESPRFLQNNHTQTRLLVDSSGDCAVMLNPKQSASSKPKRSDIIRLPPAETDAAYNDSFEIREVLYLPLKGCNGSSFPPLQSTSCNFLYLYPISILVNGDHHKKKGQCYSIRMRLVRQLQSKDSKIYETESAIYNPSCLGDPILQSIYTSIPINATRKKNSSSTDFFSRDEVKVRLPRVLDGSHFLQFSLYTVDIDSKLGERSGGIKQTLVGETLIPLSSTSTNEGSASKISIAIPDGLHRIRLANFEFQVQSRLFSQVHVCDPSLVAVIQELSIDQPGEMGRQGDVGKLLSRISNETIFSHFHLLFYSNLTALLDFDAPRFDFVTGEFSRNNDNGPIFESVKTILRLLLKLKEIGKNDKLLRLQSKKYFKYILDFFDNKHISIDASEDGEGALEESTHIMDFDDSFSLGDDWFENESHPNKPSNLNPLSSRIASRGKEIRLRQTLSSLKISSPLNRKAYGVSKTDRMKAEAELYESNQYYSELAEDDETVVSAATWQSQARQRSSAMSVSTPAHSYNDQAKLKLDGASLSKDLHNLLYESDHAPFEASVMNGSVDTPLEKAKDFTKKLNTLAALLVRPCVTPNDNNVAGDGERISNTLLQSNDPRIQALRRKVGQSNKVPKMHIFSGSDDEEEEASIVKSSRSKQTSSNLRGRASVEPFELKLNSRNKANTVPFVYEILLQTWLHSFNKRMTRKNSTAEEYINPMNFLLVLEFLLPLCLKSLALRCSQKKRRIELIPSTTLDKKHLNILDPLIAHISFSIVLKASNADSTTFRDELLEANTLNDSIIEFLSGLLSIIHPAQAEILLTRYLNTIRDCEELSEDKHSKDNDQQMRYMQRLHVCRQLRLRAIEKISSLPRFLALNLPHRYESDNSYNSSKAASWIDQEMGGGDDKNTSFPISDDKLPRRHWLAEVLLEDCFSICHHACDMILHGTDPHTKQMRTKSSRIKLSSMKHRIPLSKTESKRQQSIANYAITLVYDCILRKQASDERFQDEEVLHRISSIFLQPIIKHTIDSIYLLSKLEAQDKIRCTWLMCLVYVLQEAPEVAIRKVLLSLCNEPGQNDSRPRKFLEALSLGASSFQGFASKTYSSSMTPWLIQESFNTISAAAIVLVDECCDVLSSRSSFELKNVTEGALSLLLSITSTPLSSVTLLRALGAVSHVLDKVGAIMFLSSAGDTLQHWGRILFSLMNSTSLSVRSMSVDLVISLFGSIFKECGSVDDVSQVFLTVLPEAVAREISMYGASKKLKNMECVEKSLWPLRRALADIDDADPVDDDRVDISLQPFLKHFCRACQAVVDGVFIEIRLLGEECLIVGSSIETIIGTYRISHSGKKYPLSWLFDADEESIIEIADFFSSESSPIQRIRWLLTLKKLHVLKGQWVEAAETLILTARTIADAMPHVKNIWRPSYFKEWSKLTALAKFSDDFLEPSSLSKQIDTKWRSNEMDDGVTNLPLPSISTLCNLLALVMKEAIFLYDKESRTVPLAYSRSQEVLRIIMGVTEDHTSKSAMQNNRRGFRTNAQNIIEETASLRKVSASINEIVTKLAERLHLIAGNGSALTMTSMTNLFNDSDGVELGTIYVRVMLYGKKIKRFQESTTIPTFLDWNIPYICRVPDAAIASALKNVRGKGEEYNYSLAKEICKAFAEPLCLALQNEANEHDVVFDYKLPASNDVDDDKTYITVSILTSKQSRANDSVESKRFHVIGFDAETKRDVISEITVAKYFPCALSRQSVLVTTERNAS